MTADILSADTVATSDRLSFTFFLALALHAILILGVSFNADRGNHVSPTIEITLAAYKSQKAPKEADYLAQFNQEASGTQEQAKELTTPRPAEISDTQVNDITPQPQIRATTRTDRQEQKVTTSGSSRYKAQSQIDPKDNEEEVQRDGKVKDIPLNNPELASLRAKLDRQREEYAKRPRIRRLTSVATKASYDAEYLHKWSTKVEFVGNNNYPEEALRNKVFGDLRLAAVLLPNGTVHRVEILQSSGHRVLDDAAKQIVRLASPFDPFPPEIRREVDQLEIIRTWRFEITGLSTSN